jgi:IMP dehydrogenase
MEQGLEYSDVLIKPVVSNISSRDDVDISYKFNNGLKIDFPLLASPMKNIVDVNFLTKLSDLGGLGFLHRFHENRDLWRDDIGKLRSKGVKFGVSIGLFADYEWILNYEPQIILIDVANGYLTDLHKFCNKIKNYIVQNKYKTLLMAGNVVEDTGVLALKNSGVDIARVIIGGGANCSTRNVTGVSIPSITAIQMSSQIDDIVIVADGGIKYSGDLTKAIVAGADIGMAGTLFAETYESPADGKIFGMASRALQEEMGYKIKSVEGFTTEIEKKHSLEQFMSEFGFGIKSAGTYLNARNLNEIRKNGKFIRSGNGSIKNL